MLTAQPADLCNPSTPPSWGGTPVERGSDMATEGKGRLRPCISNAGEQDGWWRLQWKQHVFTSQRISNSLFHRVRLICLVALVHLSLRLEDMPGMEATIFSGLPWSWFGYWSHFCSFSWDYLCFFFLILRLQPPPAVIILATGTNGSKHNSRRCQAKDGYPEKTWKSCSAIVVLFSFYVTCLS